jgi:hypothetical protein
MITHTYDAMLCAPLIPQTQMMREIMGRGIKKFDDVVVKCDRLGPAMKTTDTYSVVRRCDAYDIHIEWIYRDLQR